LAANWHDFCLWCVAALTLAAARPIHRHVDVPLHHIPEASLGKDADDLAVARRVLDQEAAGLAMLGRALDAAGFGRAVDLLAGATGRVVVTGMGKSGHVARKVAATFASTGTPALFVHPAEASHGDLGMIVPGDAVLALSNSGETPELADLVAHARRFGLPLVAITGRAESALARAADQALLLPPAPEACPLGLAPTTSTTMQLALGDALAVALLTRRGFGPADFRVFHPGGRLGARLSRVRDLMHGGAEMPLAPPDTRMDAALVAMTAKRFGCLGIVDGGRLVGIITDGDLRRALDPGPGAAEPRTGLLARGAAEVMTRAPRTIGPDALAVEALRVMEQRSITALFVVDGDGAPVGILHIHDLLRAGVA
jgi:arabinose-5-phosphate isomerase